MAKERESKLASLDYNLLSDRQESFKLFKWNSKQRSIQSSSRLASLGFYALSTSKVSCFYCRKNYQVDENPFDKHLTDPCGFVILRRTLPVLDSNFQKQIDKCGQVQVDVSEELQKSFVDWPYGEGRGQQTPTAVEVVLLLTKVAKAGFFHLQYEIATDDVICLACNSTLNMWDEGDDPLEEHRKRSPECSLVIAALKSADEDKVVKAPKTKTKKPQNIRAKKASVEAETFENIKVPAAEPEKVPKASKATKTAKPARKGRGKAPNVNLESRVEEVVKVLKAEEVKTVQVEEVIEDLNQVAEAVETTSNSVIETPSPDTTLDEDPIDTKKRGKKETTNSKKRQRKATPLTASNTPNISLPPKQPNQSLGAYMDLIHDSTPVNSILTKEMLVEVYESNSEKTLSDFLGVLGQKAARVLDSLMPTE